MEIISLSEVFRFKHFLLQSYPWIRCLEGGFEFSVPGWAWSGPDSSAHSSLGKSLMQTGTSAGCFSRHSQTEAPQVSCHWWPRVSECWVKSGKSNSRRKFRSQTSDNMDTWKAAEMGRVREERRRRKKIKEEKFRRKKEDPVCEKVEKSRFHWFVAPEGRKVGSLKRWVRSQLARWEMKNCTPLWREAHFQVKMYKTHHARTTFVSWDV